MRKNMSWSIGIFLCMALLVTGCGGNSDGSNIKADTSQGAATTLRIALDADPPKLDPSFSTALVERMVQQSIFDPLVDIGPNGEIVPMLAEKWMISEDKKTYTFQLRPNVKFQDGTDFNAEAVKFTLDRNMDKSSPRRGDLSMVDNVIAVDTLRINVQLKQPFAPFLVTLSGRAGMIVSPTAVKKHGKAFINNPVGTGPFSFKEHKSGVAVLLEKNPHYWQQGLPKMDKVEYKVITDTNVALINLKSGEVDMTNKFPYKEIALLKNDPKIKVVSEPGYAYRGMYVNTKHAPFDKKETRQAVDMMINRDVITRVILSGAGSPAHSPFTQAHFSYGESDKAPSPDIAKAKELLQKAGLPNGFQFTLKVDPNPTYQQIGQMIQNMLKPAGIQMNIEKVEFGTLLDQAANGNFQTALLGWSGSPDPDQNIYDLYVTDGTRNYSRYANPKLDKLLQAARVETADALRKEKYDAAMQVINEDIPYIYFYHDYNVFGLSTKVDGFEYVPDGIIRTATILKK